jgi:hypothetical protein
MVDLRGFVSAHLLRSIYGKKRCVDEGQLAGFKEDAGNFVFCLTEEKKSGSTFGGRGNMLENKRCEGR